MARPGLAHEATRAARASRSGMSTELGVGAQSSRLVSATSLPNPFAFLRLSFPFCTVGIEFESPEKAPAGLGFCPKAFQNLRPRSFSPQTVLGVSPLTQPGSCLGSSVPMPPGLCATVGTHREMEALDLSPEAAGCLGRSDDPHGRAQVDPALAGAGPAAQAAWACSVPWDPSRSVSPQLRPGRKPSRGSRWALTGARPRATALTPPLPLLPA